jgi:hypothetical protein
MPDLCLSCVGDVALKEQLKHLSTNVTCTYCGKPGVGLSVEAVAAAIDEPLRVAYCHGQVRPHFATRSDSLDWEQEGEDLAFLLQEELGTNLEPAVALAQALIEADPADVASEDEPFFTIDQLYERTEVLHGWDYFETWNAFAARIKYRRRFFDSEAIHQLGQILGEPGSPEAQELPIAVIGPDQQIQRVFRARRPDSADKARLILAFPRKRPNLASTIAFPADLAGGHVLGSCFVGVTSVSGADRDRTGDPLLAKQVLSQLSYRPEGTARLKLAAFAAPSNGWRRRRSWRATRRAGIGL